MNFAPEALDAAASYRLLIRCLAPRPIAWVGSRSGTGVDNLAPFSYFMGVSTRPVCVAFSVAELRGGGLKDTARNVLETGEFTVSFVEESMLDPMHQSSAPYAESEFDAVGIDRGESTVVRPPRVAAARAAIECKLHQSLPVGNCTLFIGEVVQWHLADSLWNGGQLDFGDYLPVGRLGGDDYALLRSVVSRPPARV